MLVIEAVDTFLEEARALREDSQLDSVILKAAEGDNNAFTTLYNKFIRLLTTVARAKAKGAAKSDVDDIVQNTFLKFYEKELPKFAAKMKAGERKGADLVHLLKTAVRNATADANKAAARKGLSHRRIGEFEPSQGAVLGKSEKHLGARSKKVVRAAYKRALAKAKLKPVERKFIMALFGQTEFKVPEHGTITAIADKVGLAPGKNQKQLASIALKAKNKFLKTFCTDKELCALLPHFKGELGRARDVSKRIPGLGGNICKDHTCEEVEFIVGLLGEEFAEFDQGGAQDLVLSWIARNLSED
jgi:DNA-directed RNA polymerase specialized sigma24 family protein